MSGSIDTSDILVVVDRGEQYNVNLQPPDQYGVSIQAGDTYVVSIDLPTTTISTNTPTYYRVSDYATFAATASFFGGLSASIPWDNVADKPTGLLSSSQQINQLANVSASFATTSSYALNAGSGVGFPFSGSAIITGSLLVSGGNIIGTSSLAQTVIGGLSRYVPLWTGSLGNELTSSIIYQTAKGIFIGYDTNPHTHSPEGETLAVHSGETGVKNVIYAHGTFDDDYRINVRNISSGVSASTNYKATSDIGNDVGGFVEMGINSSTYSRTDQIGGPLDAYLYTTGSDLLLGTLSPDKRVIIFTGPGDADNNARVFIDSSGSVGINTSTPTPGNPEALVVEAITNSYNLITARAIVDNYAQINIKNLSGGNSASADVVATANNGTETSNYIDMGINSDQFGLLNGVGGPNDAYLYSTGNQLHIGNASEDRHIMFFAGGSDSEANAKLTLEANNQHVLSGSLNVTGSLNVLAGVINNLTASFAVTASYVSGAASTWDTIANKPANLVSSSAQATLWTVLSASFATSASWAPTILPLGTISSSAQVDYNQIQNKPTISATASYVEYANVANKPTLVSSSTQINTGSFSGSFTGNLVGTSSWANNAISASAATSITFTPTTASFATSASFAPTILPTGVVSSSTQINYTQLQNIPSGIVSSSTQIITLLPTGIVSSSAQINTGSFSGSFIGTFTGTSSFATSASNAITASYVLPSGIPAGIISSSTQVVAALPAGTVSSSTQINTGSFSGSLIGTASWAFNVVSASFATTASAATSITFTPATASFALTASYVSGAASTWDGISDKPEGLVSSSLQAITWAVATASYISGGVVIIGTPTDGAYGGSAGNVSGINAGDKTEDAFDKIETILGRLAPAKPANLSTRTLTTNATVFTAYSASGVTPVLYSNITLNARPTSSWTFVVATSGSSTTLSFDGDSGVLQAEVDGVVTLASQDTLTTSSDAGTYGNLIINQDLDPYAGTFGQQGFWKGFIASVAPTASLPLGPHTARLLHSTTGNTPIFTWYLDNASTPSITTITGSSTGGTTRYVSGVPTLATGETVIILVTGSNAISQFYNSTRIFSVIGNNSVASTANATLPSIPPVSASVASASITLTVLSNAFTSASTYTATIFNSAGTSAQSTWTPTAPIRVDTISNESARCRSGIGWYPSINSTVSGAGAIWTASANLTGSRELQMTNNLYHYPSSSNYGTNYPLPGPDYRGLVAETTASFPNEAVRWVTFSGSVNAASNVSVVFNNTNAAFVGTQTTGSMRLYVLVSGTSATNGWIDGATSYPGTGNPTNNGDPALVFGSSTATTKVITFGSSVKTGTVFVRVGIPSSSLAGSTRSFSGVTITQV